MPTEGRNLLLLLTADSLAAHPKAEELLHRMLSQFFDELPEDSVLLTAGRPGPDTWACEAAEGYGFRWVAYLTDGRRLDSTDEGVSERRWSQRAAAGDEHARALVDAAQKAKRAGWQVQVVLAALSGDDLGEASSAASIARSEGLAPTRIDVD